ncbi:MAG: hypothetical protein ACI8RD_007104 [Bacillariaceae sp.]|jgi:hypothetical protein
MDYGLTLNKLLGRNDVGGGENFWGTRTEHIVGVAACLAVTDHASQSLFKNIYKKELCFAKSPTAFVAHTFFFIFTGVTIYVAGDAALNPSHEGKRFQEFKDGTYASYVGSNTAWFEPFVPVVVARFAGPVAGASWLGSSLLPATLAYTTVKGVGWNDWGNHGLNETEMKMNGLWKKE